MTWTIPNILTVGRIIAAPCVALVFLVFDRPLADWLAFGLFVAAAVTDFFDGWLARRLNQTSEIGKMLDPIADKAMVLIALLALFLPAMITGPVNLPYDPTADHRLMTAMIGVPAIVIICREVLVSGLREFLGDVKLPVTNLAKLKTTAQMIAIGALLLVNALKWEAIPTPANAFDSVRTVLRGDAAGGTDPVAILEPVGISLLWLAAVLTVITGWDYFRKGMAYIRDREER